MKKIITIGLILGLTGCSLFTSKVEANTNINGSVESRCSINTDTAGYYGNPNAYTLNTTASDGGQKPILRLDVSLASAYIAAISYPTSFSSSPSLSDSVAFTGGVAVVQVSASGMDGYQAASTVTNSGSTRNYNLSTAGSTWFEVTSQAVYGGNKAFPSGSYATTVVAECIAQ
tara:strand:- start:787 stop:1305 length:519 start_codon:yes stop_codon:yes gene_type:complete